MTRQTGRAGTRAWRGIAGAVAAVALLLAAAPAPAGQRTVRPLKLNPLSSRQADLRDPFSVRSGGPYDSEFWAPVRLPLGAVIRGVRYQHASDGGATTHVTVIRVRPDSDEAIQSVVSANSAADTGSNHEFVTVSSPPATGPRARVKAGWRYAVWVVSSGPDAAVGKVTVLY